MTEVKKYNLTSIVSIDQNDSIGFKGNQKIPWRYTQDMKRFQALTTFKTIVMGRSTFETLGNKPLKNRRNIVLSTTLEPKEGVEVYKSIPELLAALEGDCFNIGGEQLYNQLADVTDHLDITIVPDLINETPDQKLAYFKLFRDPVWKLTKSSYERIRPDEDKFLYYRTFSK